MASVNHHSRKVYYHADVCMYYRILYGISYLARASSTYIWKSLNLR